MFTKLKAAAVMGLECLPVDVEVDINKGQTNFAIVGLADTAIKEAKDRIYSAIKNSDFFYPFNFRILVNLAPADIHKEGPAYDLPMAVGIIVLSNRWQVDFRNTLLVGELALNGALRHTTGILPLAMHAKENNLSSIFVPRVDALEASLVEGLTVYPISNLREIIEHFAGVKAIKPFTRPPDWNYQNYEYQTDISLVKGQKFAKRALEIAAAGAHNLILTGPPGAGKTLLARTAPSILPRLSHNEALEVTKIYSVAGRLPQGLISARPFRSPHHTASAAALVGGGRIPRPGEISLAHRGVLFLDEFPEFPRTVIESLRQPLEDGVVTISRAQGSLTFPAQFVLMASRNPCPCGFLTDPDKECICSPRQLEYYQKKLSGPILDRIDLHVEVPKVKFNKLISNEQEETSNIVRGRVEEARQIQAVRFKNKLIHANGEMGNTELKEFCFLDAKSMQLVKQAVGRLQLSARAYHRVLKVSRTIADLDKSTNIKELHLAEALQFRGKG